MVINLRDAELRICDRLRARTSNPAGASPFFGLPVSELMDMHVDLETLWGPSGRELRDRLRAATGPTETFRVLEAALVGRLAGSTMRHDAVRFALGAFSRPQEPGAPRRTLKRNHFPLPD